MIRQRKLRLEVNVGVSRVGPCVIVEPPTFAVLKANLSLLCLRALKRFASRYGVEALMGCQMRATVDGVFEQRLTFFACREMERLVSSRRQFE